MQRAGLRLRSARVQHYSPDPDYGPKRDALLACLREAAVHPEEIVLVFLDEMGFYRWPDPARTARERSFPSPCLPFRSC